MEKQVESMLRGGQFHQILESYIKQVRDKYDLKKTEVEVLYYFAKAGSYNTSKDVTNYLHMNKGHISTTLDSLCKKGLLIGSLDSLDRRVVHFVISDKACEMVAEIEGILSKLNRELFVGVTMEDKKALERVAKQIAMNIENMKREV